MLRTARVNGLRMSKQLLLGTFSILAMSPSSGLVGVAVASGSPSVGDRVPHAKPGVGVVATQAYTNVFYGTRGLELLTGEVPPKEVLTRLLKDDPGRELRQVAIMDFRGRKAVFTGTKAPQFRGESVGEDCVAIGNLLAGKEVVKSMVTEFENSTGNVEWRMAKALKAGSENGGDRRGEISAALIVVGAEEAEVEIKIDRHADPIDELLCRLSQ